MDQQASPLAEGLRKLPAAYREVVILRFYEGMRLEEIARHLGVPGSTVRNRLRRALRRLRKSAEKNETF
jgi:RNA polymerase sigma-70 factor (ECF subfamily)